MIIFLYGDDSFRSKQKLNDIIARYKETAKSGLNLTYVNADQTEFQDFYDNLKMSTMFSEKKLVIVQHAFSDKEFQEDLVKEFKHIDSLKDVVVISEEQGVDERTKLFKLLKKEAKSQEFTLLDGRSLKLWADKEFEKYHSKINNDAELLLIGYVGPDLWRLSLEIQKLCLLKSGSVIKKEDVEVMVKPKIESDIFKTIDALAAKNKRLALDLLHRHVDSGDSPLYLLSMVTYQFRNLLVVKELAGKGLMYASIVKKSGLHPFVVKKNYFASSQFSFEELQRIYRRIFQIDSDIKTGKIEPEVALDFFVSSI